MYTVQQVRVIRRKLFVKINGEWCLLACGVTNTMYAENHFVATVQSSLFDNRHIIMITFNHLYAYKRYIVDSQNIIQRYDKLTAEDILEFNKDTKTRLPELIEDDIKYLEKLDKETFTFPTEE